MVLGLTDHASDVLPLPRYEVPVQGGHVDPEMSESPQLVVHGGKAPDHHVDVAVSSGAVPAAAVGAGAAVGAVLEVSDVIMKSGGQNVLRLCERSQVENLKPLVVQHPCKSEQKGILQKDMCFFHAFFSIKKLS